MRYVLVKITDSDVQDDVQLCKDIEELLEFKNYTGTAILVRKPSDEFPPGVETYVGEFYSTPQAVERIA